jgi:hypothetical protein
MASIPKWSIPFSILGQTFGKLYSSIVVGRPNAISKIPDATGCHMLK